jgi:hypothetical protein
MGSANLNGTGNAIDNQIFANSGDNILDGGGTRSAAADNPVAYLYGSISGGVTHFGLIQGGGDTASYLYGATSGVTVSLAVGRPSGYRRFRHRYAEQLREPGRQRLR